MSDFLRNLRTSHKKETPVQRRTAEGNFYSQRDRRKITDRRFNKSERFDPLHDAIENLLPQLIENSTELLSCIQKKAEKDDLLVEAKIRESEAISIFFENLNQIFLSSSPFSGPGPVPAAKATASYTTGTHYTKEDILSIIRQMRQNGSTFATIAQYLKDKGIPTFSGRGDWHAQTIHRLCK